MAMIMKAIIRNDDGSTRGIAFVTYADEKGVENAIKYIFVQKAGDKGKETKAEEETAKD